jgi:hypothetical protein
MKSVLISTAALFAVASAMYDKSDAVIQLTEAEFNKRGEYYHAKSSRVFQNRACGCFLEVVHVWLFHVATRDHLRKFS